MNLMNLNLILIFTMSADSRRADIHRGVKTSGNFLSQLAAQATVTNRKNIFHYIEVNLGTPRQKFRVIIDTGSANLWVLAKGGNFPNHCTYDSGRSSTYVKNGRDLAIFYGSGSTRGVLSSDTLTIGEIEVTGQIFGEMTHSDFSLDNFDGILGLGFPALAADGVTPPFQNMVKQGKIDRSIFGVYLSRNPDSNVSGQITFGFVDHRHHRGPITYVDVQNLAYWKFNIERVTFGDLVFRRVYAVADTGTTMIYGPQSQVAGILRKLNVSDGFDCGLAANFPELKFEFGGRTFVMTPWDYCENIAGRCYVFIRSLSNIDFWLLGDTFLRKYFSVYDFDRNLIGFADASEWEELWANKWDKNGFSLVFGALSLIFYFLNE